MLSSEPGHTKTGRWELGGVEAGCERREREREQKRRKGSAKKSEEKESGGRCGEKMDQCMKNGLN